MYCFNVCIVRSTWILARAIFLVFATSLGVNWVEIKNGDNMSKNTPLRKMSDKIIPLSAICKN